MPLFLHHIERLVEVYPGALDSGILERVATDALTDTDWNTLYKAYQLALREYDQPDKGWIEGISQRFGASGHFVDRRDNRPGTETSPSVSHLGMSALHFVFGLSDTVSPLPVGVAEYLKLDPALRTHFTDQWLVADLALSAITRLTIQDISDPQKLAGYHHLTDFLDDVALDIKTLLLEHETVPILIYENAVNSFFGGTKSLDFFRTHVNMTTINEKDHTNNLGTKFLTVVRDWLREKPFMVVQNPENTSFQFVAVDQTLVRSAMTNFELEVKRRMRHLGVTHEQLEGFVPKAILAQKTLKDTDIFNYALQTDDDFYDFLPALTFQKIGLTKELLIRSFGEGGIQRIKEILYGMAPDFATIKKNGGPLVRITGALVFKALLEFNKILAAETTYFEKEGSRQDALAVYGSHNLPGPDFVDRKQKEKLDYHLHKKSGFVGPALYDPVRKHPELAVWRVSSVLKNIMIHADRNLNISMEGFRPGILDLLDVFPRLSRIKGLLTHSRPNSPGGILEIFKTALNELLIARGEAQIQEALSRVTASAEKLRELLGELTQLASRDPRNAFLRKKHDQFSVSRGHSQQMVHSHFFVEDVARLKNIRLAVLEFDSFKAFNEAYPSASYADDYYNGVLDQVFLTAFEMGLPKPELNRGGGDQINISFSTQADAALSCKKIQERVSQFFKDKPFQDLHKVDVVSFKLEGDIQLEALLKIPDFMEALRKRLKLKAVPHLEEVSRNHPRALQMTVSIAKENTAGEIIAVESILEQMKKEALSGRGLLLTPLRVVSRVEEVKRLKIWKPAGSGDKPNPQDLVFSKEPVSGYEPFMRTLTVSVVVGEHKAITSMADKKDFIELQDRLGHELEAAKKANWPYKEGFRDTRPILSLTSVNDDKKLVLTVPSPDDETTPNGTNPLAVGEQSTLARVVAKVLP